MLEQGDEKKVMEVTSATLELQVYIFLANNSNSHSSTNEIICSTLLTLYFWQIQEKNCITQQLQDTFKLNMATQLEDEKEEKLVKKTLIMKSSSRDHAIQYRKPFPGYWDFYSFTCRASEKGRELKKKKKESVVCKWSAQK